MAARKKRRQQLPREREARPATPIAANVASGNKPRQRWVAPAAFFAMSLGCLLLTADVVHYSRWGISADLNASAVEGYAWNFGRLDLAIASQDTAVFSGKIYNVFPPLFSIIATTVLAIAKFTTSRYAFPGWVYMLILVAPLLVVTFWAFWRCTNSPWRAALLGIQLFAGTALLVQLVACQAGWIWQTNHVLSQVGLLLIVGDCLGKKRLWPSLIGLLIAAWSRQLTVLYAFPIALIMVRRWWQGLAFGLVLVGVLAVPMGLNWLKFGSPFDSGYMRIYEGQNDPVAQRAHQGGLFNLKFVPENLYYMNLAVPVASDGGLKLRPDEWGASFWLGTPVLLYLFITWRQWWADRDRRVLVLGTLPIIALLLMYHNTGWQQLGHYRFSLDFLPILLGVIAPFIWGRWRTPITFGMLIWSLIYFRWIALLFGARFGG